MNAVYDFDHDDVVNKIVCFSDVEGGSPFKSISVRSTDSQSIDSAMTFLDSIPYSLQPDSALVFLGDAQDNGGSSLRMLLRLVELKQRAPGRIILILGNRDVNKMRLADEALLVDDLGVDVFSSFYTSKTTSKTSDAFNFEGLVKYVLENKSTIKFKYSAKDLLMDNAPWIKDIPDDIGTRISYIFDKTMNAPGAASRLYDEIDEECKLDLDTPDTHIAATILCMLMSRHWPQHILPGNMHKYNGLYLKFITESHVCATFKFNGRVSFASHGGLPQAHSVFTSVLGFVPTGPPPAYAPERLSDRLSDVVDTLDGLWKTAFVDQTRSSAVGTLPWRHTHDVVRRLIYMSGPSKPADELTVAMSPIVAFKPPHDIDGARNYFSGGTDPVLVPYDSDRTMMKAFDWSKGTAADTIAYNLFGHQPRGMAPHVKASGTGTLKTWHVCMDVSKVDGNASAIPPWSTAVSDAVAMLVMSKSESHDYFYGRFNLLTANNPINHIFVGGSLRLSTFQSFEFVYKLPVDELAKLQDMYKGSAVIASSLGKDSTGDKFLIRHRTFANFTNAYFISRVGDTHPELPHDTSSLELDVMRQLTGWVHLKGGGSAAVRRRPVGKSGRH